MASITTGDLISSSAFKSALKEKCAALLPSSGYYDNTTTVPTAFSTSYLTSRATLISAINSDIDAYCDTTIATNKVITSNHVFELFKIVFKHMGCCRKMYYYDMGAVSPGSQKAASTIATEEAASAGGTWTYFKDSFAWTGNLNVMPKAAGASVTNVNGYQTFPHSNTNWQNNTQLATNTVKVSELSINNLIKAVTVINTQLENFCTEFNTKNSNTSYWDGNAENSSNISNRVLFVRYWCHTNCHYNCHTDRARR